MCVHLLCDTYSLFDFNFFCARAWILAHTRAHTPRVPSQTSSAPAPAARTLNINVGVLGHVDSGKTSLVRALSTELSTAALDKHPQSQERGITLDLGFSGFFVDAPTHVVDRGYDRVHFTLVDWWVDRGARTQCVCVCCAHIVCACREVGGHSACVCVCVCARALAHGSGIHTGLQCALGLWHTSAPSADVATLSCDLLLGAHAPAFGCLCFACLTVSPGHAGLIRTIIGGAQIIDLVRCLLLPWWLPLLPPPPPPPSHQCGAACFHAHRGCLQMVLVIDAVKGIQTQTAEVRLGSPA